jgi:hypothetical protein
MLHHRSSLRNRVDKFKLFIMYNYYGILPPLPGAAPLAPSFLPPLPVFAPPPKDPNRGFRAASFDAENNGNNQTSVRSLLTVNKNIQYF